MSGPLLDWHPLVSLSYGFDVCSNLSLLTCFLVFISKSEKKERYRLIFYRVLKSRFVNDIDLSECCWDSMFLFRDSCFDQDQWYVHLQAFSMTRMHFQIHSRKGFLVHWKTDCIHNQRAVSIALVCRTWFCYSEYSPTLKHATLVIHILYDYMLTTRYGWNELPLKLASNGWNSIRSLSYMKLL